MIIQEFVEVKINNNNRRHYESLGYKIPKMIRDNNGRLTKDSFPSITVKVKDLTNSSYVKVLCECEYCGKKRLLAYKDIMSKKHSFSKDGETICPSCRNKKRLKNKIQDKKYASYKNNANQRGLNFNISEEDFIKITNLECFYCGEKIENMRNGVDRIDSSIGYETNNVVPCCTMCNIMKNKYSYESFLDKIKKIYKTCVDI